MPTLFPYTTLFRSIVPRILSISPASPFAVDGSGNATITLEVSPQAWVDQAVSLLVGDREFRAEPRTVKDGTLVFPLSPAPLGKLFLRVRVDGVDSFVVADYSASPPSFDPAVQVEITA